MSGINGIDINRLVAETRRAGFDFEKVAQALSSEDGHVYTAAEIRLRYASTFLVTSEGKDEEEKVEEITDGMSFHDVMEVIENRSERNERRKEKVFNRVLVSLGSGSSAKEAPQETPELQLIKTTMDERKRKKEREHEQKLKELKEKEEVEWLARERERLKQRNEPGSIDAEGEIPQFVMEGEGAEKKMNMRTITEEGEVTDGDGTNKEGEDGGYDFDVEKVFGDENLDILLEQIEKELEAQAVAKPSIDDTPSELTEVLQFLDAAAASSSKNKTTAIVMKEINTGARGHSTKHSDRGTKENHGPTTTEKNVRMEDTKRSEFYSNNNNNNNKKDDDEDDDNIADEDWKDARMAMKSKASSLMSQPTVNITSTSTTISPTVECKITPSQPDATVDHSPQQNLTHGTTTVPNLPSPALIEEESVEAVEVTGILALRRAREGGHEKRPPRVLKSS